MVNEMVYFIGKQVLIHIYDILLLKYIKLF